MMRIEEPMNAEINKITHELKENILKKYDLQEMRLFGSSVRGDRKPESDIDIFICLSDVNRKIEEDLFDTAYDMELKYGYTIDVLVFDRTIHDGVNTALPVYQNILNESILI
jgi:uncharacterized protein